MSKEELMSLPRVVEKDGTMNMINKPGWIWFNPFDFSNLLEMKWFSFILIFAILYGVTFITFGALFHLLNYSHGMVFTKMKRATRLLNAILESRA